MQLSWWRFYVQSSTIQSRTIPLGPIRHAGLCILIVIRLPPSENRFTYSRASFNLTPISRLKYSTSFPFPEPRGKVCTNFTLLYAWEDHLPPLIECWILVIPIPLCRKVRYAVFCHFNKYFAAGLSLGSSKTICPPGWTFFNTGRMSCLNHSSTLLSESASASSDKSPPPNPLHEAITHQFLESCVLV